MHRLAWITAFLGLLSTCGLPRPLVAGDWPQILGPFRNGLAENESLASSWNGGAPATRWERPVGHGLAGIAVAEGIAVLFHRVGDEDLVEAMNAKNGEVLWHYAFKTSYQPSIDPNDGPLCVPVIHNSRVYIYGAQGRLACLNLKTKKLFWMQETHSDLKALEGYFGAGSTPLIEGDKILVNVGGSRGGIAAYALDGGKLVWTKTRDGASYSSPVAATINGVRHVIFLTRLNAVSLDPSSGKIRFQFPFGKRGPTVNAANPLVLGDKLFLSASYRIGAVYANIEPDAATIIWNNDEVMSSQYTTCVVHDGLLFGIHGRQDMGVAELRCFDPQTRKIHWSQPGFGYATLIKADDKLILLKTNGELVLAVPNAAAFRELTRARLLESRTRALPALADGLFYARDETTLKCVDLGSARRP